MWLANFHLSISVDKLISLDHSKVVFILSSTLVPLGYPLVVNFWEIIFWESLQPVSSAITALLSYKSDLTLRPINSFPTSKNILKSHEAGTGNKLLFALPIIQLFVDKSVFCEPEHCRDAESNQSVNIYSSRFFFNSNFKVL